MYNFQSAVGIFPVLNNHGDTIVNTNFLIHETRQLAQTCGIQIVKDYLQKIEKVNPSTAIGRGKLTEIRYFIIKNNINIAIINIELSPSQLKNIQDILKVKIIDRSDLILEIFRRNARTRESKLQVELAKLKYELPRLIGKTKGLEQFQIGFGNESGVFAGRGPGEKQIEYDRRTIKNQIYNLTQKLKVIENRKKSQLKKRTEEKFIITLIGYTNAGKSTLFNHLTNSNVITRNTPFSTLDTKSALLKIEGNLSVFINDTVGFIQNIPDDLVNAFLTTLEDIKQSDLLIHIVDSSVKNYEKQIHASETILGKLGCGSKKKLLVFNKTDLIEPYKLVSLENKFPDAIFISSRERRNIEALKTAIFNHINDQLTEIKLRVPVVNGRLLPELHNNYSVRETKLVNSHIVAKVLLPKRDAYKYSQWINGSKN